MMATTRQEAVREIATEILMEGPVTFAKRGSNAATNPLPEIFGELVFNDLVQRQRLQRNVYQALRSTIETGSRLDPAIADDVAQAMKEWALELGATHYTHWFQPMTGLTAEKHDSFLMPTPEGGAVLEFSGKQLVQGEPDASSFPSGGLRATFEARGYTAWDPTSPAFLRKTADGATLTIPTAFCSWTGEALDKKTPLLRSCQAVSKSATRMLHLLGDNQVERVAPTAGVEQEYFLIDRQFFNLRPDLMACGRTLFGAPPMKGQEFDDHYFGNINPRALSFMTELEQELWRLGIPMRTRHNEVAPSQFELAPMYSGISVSTDQNLLTMDVLREVAQRHGFEALLHEKPYARLNGSGKHLNWSLTDSLGRNLLEPGDTPHKNVSFLVTLAAIVRGVDLHQDLLRASVANAGNDHRLGANEAPPAIISIFVGTELEDVIDALIEGRAPASTNGNKEMLRLGVTSLPDLPRDSTDRNRTSPFAFTGNKFEFRAVSSSQSVAYPAALLNVIVAESMDFICDQVEARDDAVTEALQTVICEVFTKHKRIIFGGDNYSAEWTAEAAKRGLLNRRATPEALSSFASEENIALYESYGLFTRSEAVSRYNVQIEKYCGKINMEAKAALEIAKTMILPAAIAYQHQWAKSLKGLLEVLPSADVDMQKSSLLAITSDISALHKSINVLELAVTEVHNAAEGREQAELFQREVMPLMESLREIVDRLETQVDDDLWPLPKYREMLFVH